MASRVVPDMAPRLVADMALARPSHMGSSGDRRRRGAQEPPILADGRRAPDRREISLRWLAGTFLTGITSCALMGVALFAAVDGREQLALPGVAMAKIAEDEDGERTVQKGGRVVSTLAPARPDDRKIMEVSTVFREGDRDIVRRRPFAHVKIALAANHVTQQEYPAFDPLAIVAADEPAETPPQDDPAGMIYGAQVDSEISLVTRDFPLSGTATGAVTPYASAMSVEEAEEAVRTNGSLLSQGTIQVASLHYVDPRRFARIGPDLDFSAGMNARVVTENVSIAHTRAYGRPAPHFVEDVMPVRSESAAMSDVMRAAGYSDAQTAMVAGIFGNFRGTTKLAKGDILRLGMEEHGENVRIIRASLYNGSEHVMTLAENDRGFFVRANPPANADIVLSIAEEQAPPQVGGRELPTVYDGIYRAALSYGMTPELVGEMVRLMAGDVDFQSRLQPTDRLEAFFSVDEETRRADGDSDLLFVSATFGDTDIRLYRFRDPETGEIEYFDSEGRSGKQFLIRKPVPNGRFSSPYGMRRHPILGYSRMHAGVDWSARSGTPIIASGDGVVVSAGWHSGGFGRHTEIHHANGYVSTYSHQSSIAKGVTAGAKVKQGQVIGYVGSTGLSTGPHLHYELSVNGSKVDPMRVRLPDAKALEGEALAAFQSERRRIDNLVEASESNLEMATR